jgi:hypothetical protein
MLRNSWLLPVPEPVPENLLTAKPSICKNEQAREVTFRPFRPDETSSNPAESCLVEFPQNLDLFAESLQATQILKDQ